MIDAAHRTVYLSEYATPDYLVDSIFLRFELGEEVTTVTSRMVLKRNGDKGEGAVPLRLDGKKLTLQGLKLDGVSLDPERYAVTEELLMIHDFPAAGTLEVTTLLRPQENTSLEGLYRSEGMFCTQCEAEGFRAITYYPDRPDVLTLFTTTIIGDRTGYPLLLCNGNPVERGELADGRHFVTWHDPFKKPSYLFALVAGDLHCQEDRFVTCSGRTVTLQERAAELGALAHSRIHKTAADLSRSGIDLQRQLVSADG